MNSCFVVVEFVGYCYCRACWHSIQAKFVLVCFSYLIPVYTYLGVLVMPLTCRL